MKPSLQDAPSFEARPELGRVGRLAAQASRVQKATLPQMKSCRVLVFAADHGIAKEGITVQPQSHTRALVLDHAAGRASICHLAHSNDIDLKIVNAGVAGGKFDRDEVLEHGMGPGSASFLRRPAMHMLATEKAIEIGESLGGGGSYDAIGLGNLGVGQSASATVLTSKLTGCALDNIVSSGSGLSEQEVLHKHAVLMKASKRGKSASTPLEILAEFGGYDIAMMTGAILGAAASNRMVLVDGYAATAAALVAATHRPESRDAMVFCHQSDEPGHRVLLDAIGGRPLLQMDMRPSDGLGAALTWPLVKSAVAIGNEVASQCGGLNAGVE